MKQMANMVNSALLLEAFRLGSHSNHADDMEDETGGIVPPALMVSSSLNLSV